MKWTTELPNKPGWWWARGPAGTRFTEPMIVRVVEEPGNREGRWWFSMPGGACWPVSYSAMRGTLWAGPIPLPEGDA